MSWFLALLVKYFDILFVAPVFALPFRDFEVAADSAPKPFETL